MGKTGKDVLTPAAIERYLRRTHGPGAQLVAVAPLGQEAQENLKSYGYGRPLHVTFTTPDAPDAPRALVLRTMSPDPFGHDRRSDRAAALIGAFDTFAGVPRHIQPLDLGALDAAGDLVPMARGELFLVTDYVPGTLYAHDLAILAPAAAPAPRDLARARALAHWLADLHDHPAEPGDHTRDVRDTVGSGEGIFGLCDSYPADDPVATPARLCRIEQQAVAWRWRLRGQEHRARRTHGDFHPFNLLFDGEADLHVLDLSRGGVGDPADDVACLAMNYLFFGLRARGRFDGAMRALWDTFWATYLAARPDDGLLDGAAPYFTWRALVLASPVWYPDVPRELRETLLTFVERLLDGARLDPADPEALL